MSEHKRDWFRRKEEDSYSFYDQNKRFFDWDQNRTGYSSYFLKDNESLKSAAKMVSSMFKVIDVPKNTKLEHSIEPKDCHDAVVIPVPLNMLRDSEGNYLNHDVELLDAFYGASIQNAALATFQNKRDYNRTMSARSSKTKTTVQDLLYATLNTERIDKKLSNKFPGYSKFVQKFKKYKYDTTYEPLSSEEHQGKRLVETLLKFLRYPANVTEEEEKEFAKPIEQIEHYMKKHGFPKTSDDCERQSAYLYDVVNKYIEEEEKDDEDGSKGTPAPSKDEMDDFAKSLMQSLMNPDDGDDSDEFADDFQEFTEDMEEKPPMKMKHDFSKEGQAEQGNIKFIKADSNKERYKKELSKIDTCKASVLANLFARKCKDYQFSMKSMRSGRLDTNKIAEAAQNVATVYERFGQVTTNKLNIGVLIDESGSMGGNKIERARQAAIFINEVFKNIPDARLYMYGHTADGGGGGTKGDCIIRIYKEHGKGSDPHALGSADARYNNKDGDAIYACARKIRSMNDDPCLLFVLSDGAPYADNYSGQRAIEDTRKKVTMSQALGFQVIQIAIDYEVPSADMFDYYIEMTDIKNLPMDLIKYVSKKVDKLIHSKTVI